jgi:YVTN family beta-propeller protein
VEALEFGHYLLEHLIGSGGMGDVYQAFDRRRDRAVALKLLPELFSADREFQKRFRRESQVVARLREPHIIPIHDYGEIDNRLYIDMRLVDGGANVASLLRDSGAMPPGRAVRIVSQVAEALDAAHADGLIHRDIKPSNILVTSNDFVYVVDFGIAHSIGHTASSLTMTGTTVGTLDYMAPERFSSRTVDYTADVYSLACVLYECLTASKPFVGADLPSLMYAHLYSAATPPSAVDPSIPAALDEVVATGMAKKAGDRYQTAGALAEAARGALNSVTSTERDTQTPARLSVRPAVAPTRPVTSSLVNGASPAPGLVDTVAAAGLGEPAGEPHTPSGRPARVRRSEPTPPPVPRPPLRPRPRTGPKSMPPAGVPVSRTTVWLVSLLLVVLTAGLVLAVAKGLGPTGEHSPPGSVRTNPSAPAPPPIRTSVAVPTVNGSITTSATPGYAQVAPNGRFVYVTNRDPQLITVIDTTINKITATIPIPAGPPRFVAFAPDGKRAYVSIYNDQATVNLVAVLDTATNTVLTTIPVDERPFALAVSPDQRTVWVPSHDTSTIDIVDTSTNTVVKKIPVAPNPHWVAFDTADGRVYVANHESNLLTVLDPSNYSVVATIPAGKSPHSVAVSPDGRRVSEVNYDGNNVMVVDTSTNQVVATIPVGLNPQDISYAADGHYAYTANVEDGTISVIDMVTNTVTATIPIGGSPTSVAVTPDGSRAYVTSLDDAKVTILDTAH